MSQCCAHVANAWQRFDFRESRDEKKRGKIFDRAWPAGVEAIFIIIEVFANYFANRTQIMNSARWLAGNAAAGGRLGAWCIQRVARAVEGTHQLQPP
ncbi:MAG: hypothetical protein LBV29_04370 [Azoarcus sp.]|jgi:hypothetical protein|nr:hypothetical protein [Azoarcus sp.]